MSKKRWKDKPKAAVAVPGARLNPAVTLAFSPRGDFPGRRVPSYVLAQGAVATLAWLLRGPGGDPSDLAAAGGALDPAANRPPLPDDPR